MAQRGCGQITTRCILAAKENRTITAVGTPRGTYNIMTSGGPDPHLEAEIDDPMQTDATSRASTPTTPCAAPYRTSFLRRHIASQFSNPKPLGTTILGVDKLVGAMVAGLSPDDPEQQRIRRTGLEVFLDGTGEPGGRMYMPVSVLQQLPSGEPRQWGELADLLADDTLPAGIVVRARSGAGKSVAMVKCFFDAALPGGRFGGRLPCAIRPWMSDDGKFHEGDAANKLADWVETLIAEAAQMTPADVHRWIRCGPALVLFADLNVLPEKTAVALARALPLFLDAAAKDDVRHRCVVAY